jgi:hypothetical protein
MRISFVCATLAALITLPGAIAQPFLLPGFINPANIDTGSDAWPSVVMDSQGIAHAVWSSQSNYTGTAGNDFDIYYSSSPGIGLGWSAPELVNSYATLDTGDDERPKLAIGPDGTLHCVWQSNDAYGGSGTDYDILHAQRVGGSWTQAEYVNSWAATDNGQFGPAAEDTMPGITVGLDGNVYVAWGSLYNLPGAFPPAATGTEGDIFYSVRAGGAWSAGQALHSYAFTDTGTDVGPVAMATQDDGTILAVWSTNEPFANPPLANLGNDYDIVWSSLTPPGGTWGMPIEVTALARTDTGQDFDPTVATVGSGANQEIHFAWASTEPLNGSGNDFDILATALVGNFFVIPPVNNAWLVNSNALTDAATADDRNPQLLFEPGRVLHCIWQSPANLAGLTGTDIDIFHSTNATTGVTWSAMDLVNLSGLVDSAAANEDDIQPLLIISPVNNLMGAIWQSNDDLVPPLTAPGLGNDADILGALGFTRGISRPELVNITGDQDSATLGQDPDDAVALALAPNGTLHAVWRSGFANTIPATPTGNDGDIFHATLGANGWSQPDLVNTTGTTDSGLDDTPAIAIDAQGKIHVVWTSYANIGGSTGTDGDIFYSTSSGAAWSAPELVNAAGTTDTTDDILPQIAVDAGGTPHAVWISDLPLGGGVSNVSYASRGAGGWGAAEYVNAAFATPPQGLCRAFDLTLDSAGAPHVVWSADPNYNGSGADRDIFYANRTAGSWSLPQFVNDAANDGAQDNSPTAAFTPDGVLHCVWSSDLNIQGAGGEGDLFYAARTGGTWGPVSLLLNSQTNDTGQDFAPRIAVDASGDLHVAWSSNEPALLGGDAAADLDVFYAYLTTPLTPPAAALPVLANTSGYADLGPDTLFSPVSLVIDDEGRANFAWSSLDSLGGKIGADSDCLHARVTLPVLDAEEFSPDLSGWTYRGEGAQAGALGTLFPGDPNVSGQKPADAGGDGSVVDLAMHYPISTGMSYVNFTSPANLIPYHPGSTYLIRWTFSTSNAVPAQNPNVRVRWAYTPQATLGGGMITAVALPGIAPGAGGVTYTQLFDELNVPATGSFQVGSETWNEHDIVLFFEAVDFSDTVGSTLLSLDSCEITRLSRQQLLAQGTVELDVQNFGDATVVGPTGGVSFGGPVTVNFQPTSADISAPFPNPASTTADQFGNLLNLSFDGAGAHPFVPTGWPGQRRFYRARFRIDQSATLATPIPQMRLTVATFGTGQVFTSEAMINPLTSALNAGGSQLNPALSAKEFAAYLHLPSTATLGNSEAIGDKIGASLQLIDTENNLGGTVSLTGLTVVSFPEGMLP